MGMGFRDGYGMMGMGGDGMGWVWDERGWEGMGGDGWDGMGTWTWL